jgi:hypothetical protein
MGTREYIADLDIGKQKSMLSNLLLQVPLQSREVHRQYLAFADQLTYKFKAQELALLIQQYEGIGQTLRGQLVTETVARWIFTTNKIESTGLPSEGETLAFLMSRTPPQTEKQLHVAYTFDLLQQTYESNRDLSNGVLDPPSLQRWHRLLAQGSDNGSIVLPSPGVFRRCGVRADSVPELNEPEHIYPHHNAVPILIAQLDQTLYRLGKLVANDPATGHERLLLVFALAAFAQFHLVDIHPFEDGNGRLCRFLSKVILDAVCAVPFSMFPPSARTEYFRSLINGRRQNPLDSPAELMRLLLDTAIKEYGDIIRHHGNRTYTTFLCGIELEQIYEQALASHLILTEDDKQHIKGIFDNLAPDAHEDVMVGEHAVRIAKMSGAEAFIALDAL